MFTVSLLRDFAFASPRELLYLVWCSSPRALSLPIFACFGVVHVSYAFRFGDLSASCFCFACPGIITGIKLFFDVSDRAGYLFAPTAAWVSVATCLQVNRHLARFVELEEWDV